MDSKEKYLLLKTVQNDNILPLTSVCNMSCLFCSHRNNPKGLDVYSFGHLSLELIEELIEYLPEEGPVIIGESASRIIEGDPMTHPQFNLIIKLIRDQFPRKKIVITSNGSYLSTKMISFLEAMMPLELNISLNCSNPEERVFLMSDKKPSNVFLGLELLKESKLSFQGSIVAMPHVTDWFALEEAIVRLVSYAPETIRVFMPGFTKYSEDNLKFTIDELYQKLYTLVNSFNDLEIPVLMEPPLIKDFHCRIKGIIKDSPAAINGFKNGDIIKKINGRDAITRVDGFNKILKASNPKIEFLREDKIYQKELKKKAGERSGIIVDYDLDLLTIERLSSLLINVKAKKIALVTSVLGKGIIDAFLKYFDKKYSDIFYKKKIDLILVENNYFGGSIASAGLLVNQDIIKAIKESDIKYELLVLPGIMYDIFSNDLTGESYKKIESSLELSVEII
ncbi:DUF512 domain-containing protein [Natronospora cellulosivora (SeqCode)]